MSTTESKTATQNRSGLVFIKEVVKYFMDFLETDFHKRRNPKRTIKLRNEDNLLVGLNLSKYKSFNSLAWKSILHTFDKNVLSAIEKGVYKTSIPKNLLELISLQVEKISAKDINAVVEGVAAKVEATAVLHEKEYDKAFSTSSEDASKIIQDGLVLPFVSQLEKPLENLGVEGHVIPPGEGQYNSPPLIDGCKYSSLFC